MLRLKRMIFSLCLLSCFVPFFIRYQITSVASDQPQNTFPVTLHIGGRKEHLDAEQYIIGVVLAEMPSSFEEEALKAQAIAARTVSWKAVTTGGKHGDGSICSSPACCQGYISEAEYLRRFNNPDDLRKIHECVSDTVGIILTYNNCPIEATYFACSGGITEDAKMVWGTDYPYLISTNSPGEEKAYCFQDEKTFSMTELKTILHLKRDISFQNWTYTPGNGVDSVEVSGKVFYGTELRALLGLRSTQFTVSIDNNSVSFHTRGYGHRVGMSQFGADAMAASGKKYTEILSHYYEGTELQTISNFQE